MTAAVAANADGSIHGDAGTSDLPLFLIKIEGEYLCYLSQVLAANTMQVEKARALFAEGSLRARGATADFGAESPIRIGLASVFLKRDPTHPDPVFYVHPLPAFFYLGGNCLQGNRRRNPSVERACTPFRVC